MSQELFQYFDTVQIFYPDNIPVIHYGHSPRIGFLISGLFHSFDFDGVLQGFHKVTIYEMKADKTFTFALGLNYVYNETMTPSLVLMSTRIVLIEKRLSFNDITFIS
jgi:hypothetical protein